MGLGFYATESDRRNLVPPTTLVLTSQARSFPGEIAGFRDCSVAGCSVVNPPPFRRDQWFHPLPILGYEFEHSLL